MTAGAEVPRKARRGRGACVDLMEGPAWALLCVLLLADWGSAQHEEHTASFNSSSSSTVTPGASSAGPAVPSSLAPDAGAALNRSDPGPGPTAAAGRSSANVTSTLPPPPSPDPENRTHLLTTASSSRSSTPHLHLNSTPLHPTETPGEVAPTSAVLPTTSVGKVLQGTPTVTPAVTPPLTSEPANPTSASGTSQSAAPSTGPPRGAPSSASTPITSPQSTHRPETPTVTQPATTTTTTTAAATTVATPTSTSSQAKPHTNGPSQLNMGGDTTLLHRAPTPDPLLAGLVSAFVITAIILTLLVFLKLRRRNSQPEFHRLQDLPMDDMEDTPLSMYSY